MTYQNLLIGLIAASLIAGCESSGVDNVDGVVKAEPAEAPTPPPSPVVGIAEAPTPAPSPLTEVTVTASRDARAQYSSVFSSDATKNIEQSGFNDIANASIYNPNFKPVDRERYEDVEPNPVKLVTEAPVSTFSIDVDTASYAVTRRYLNEGVLPPTDAVRIEELINYFDYDYAFPAPDTHPFATHVTVTPSPWAEGRDLLHIGVQGYDVVPEERPPVNLTLLVDVSGSMQNENKLPLARKALKLLIDQMVETDTIAIVVYAGAAGTVLEPTPASEKGKIISALENLSAGGSTAGGEGLRRAYALAEQSFIKDGVNRIMMITDGDFNVGITRDERLEDFVKRKKDTGVYLSIMGVGTGNYNDQLMQTIAQAGNGTAGYLDTLKEARKWLIDDLSSNLFPIADDVKIQIEFNPASVAEYRLIGYETRILNREDFNNDKVDAGDIGAGASVTAIYEITPVGSDARQIDESRYSPAPADAEARADELAFLKLRYKTPCAAESTLITRPIKSDEKLADLNTASEAVRFSTAVAAYGQMLRTDPYMSNGFGWDDVIELAGTSKGTDEFGYRAEFIQLARLAKTAAAQAALETGKNHTDIPK